jgi:hypothetical protein
LKKKKKMMKEKKISRRIKVKKVAIINDKMSKIGVFWS